MTDKAKVVYTDEVLADMKTRYLAADTDEARAVVVAEVGAETGKGVHSVRAKMNREGYYIAKTPKAANGEKAETKEDIIKEIAAVMGLQSAENLPGLEKANKATVAAIRNFVQVGAELVFEDSETATETEGDPEVEDVPETEASD